MCQSLDKEMDNSTFRCCGMAKISLVEHCLNIFRNNGTTFAIYESGVAKECKPPCIKIEGGEMLMKECVKVIQAIVCMNGTRVTVDKEIHHDGQMCHRLMDPWIQRERQWVVLPVLLMLLVLLVLLVLAYRHREKRASGNGNSDPNPPIPLVE